jgi:hypothetical protein
MIRTAVGFIRWYLKRTGFAGITLPPWGVYILAERLTDERLVRHEQVHWEQYKRMGALKFYAVYIGYSLRYGYRNNPMEIEARAGETHGA